MAVGWYVANPKSSTSTRGLIFSMSALCLLVGFSDMLGGYDRYIYGELFDETADMVNSGIYNFRLSPVASQYPKEYGYQIYNLLLGMITDNRYIFIFITTCII